MKAKILALSTAVPKTYYEQEDAIKKIVELFALEGEKAQFAQRIYENSSIRKRHSIIDDFHKSREEWTFWGSESPGMTKRNLRYKEEAPKLALEAAKKAIDHWGGKVSEISHVISVSCTGIMAPGIEFLLMQELNMSPTVNRLGINFMGCFGAFKGLSVAQAFAKENPRNRILLVCTELCTLHLQTDQDIDNMLGHSLFADGAAAAIVGCQEENSLWEIERFHSLGFQNTLDKMSWEASDTGFQMRLSHTVPVHIGRNMNHFVEELLKNDVSIDQCDWALHPGGKSILQAIEKCLTLDSQQIKSSWEILSDYGNMSSATFLFVLEHLSKQTKLKKWTAGIGFGPGLSAEGILLKAVRQ